MITGTAQPLNEADRKLVADAYYNLAIFENACKPMHEKAREARLALLLKDPGQDEAGIDPRHRTVQLQTLVSTFNNCVADQMDNMPEALMLPETPEMQGAADDLTDVVKFVLAQNGYESLHRRRVEDFFCAGTAVTQVVWDDEMDNGRGNVAVLRWPVESFLWDPQADTLEDARALIKVSWHPMSWYEARYPDLVEYIAAEDGEHGQLGKADVQTTRIGMDEGRAMLMEYWYRRYDRKEKRYTINVAYMAGGALLEKFESVYAHGMYPFVADVYKPIEGWPVGEGMVQELLPMMRYINRYAQYIDVNLRLSSKARMLVRKSADVDAEDLADWSKDIIWGQQIDESAVRWLQHAPFNSMVTGQMLQLQTDLKQDSGQNQFTRGETAGGVTAATAIASLQEAGGKITRLRTNVLNQGFRRIVEQIIWLLSEFYTDRHVMMITGRDDRPREVDMSASHLFGKSGKGKRLPPPPYHVQVQVQRRNPLRVQAQNELFIQVYNMAAQSQAPFPLSLLFELLTIDGKERILGVVREAEASASQQAQLMQQNAEQEQTIANLRSVLGKYAETNVGEIESEAIPV